jgi:hypothetical protein
MRVEINRRLEAGASHRRRKPNEFRHRVLVKFVSKTCPHPASRPSRFSSISALECD